MANLIETNPIMGFTVYGQQMVEYTVGGVSGNDYSSAVVIAALAQATTIEKEAASYMEVVRARERKLEKLGVAMAVLTRAIDSMRMTDQESGDKSAANPQLPTVASILKEYGVYDLPVSDNKVTRKSATLARNDVEYAMNNEDNDLQQDMITLQGLVSKRDNAFNTVSKVVKKVNDTAKTIISNVRQ